MEFWTSVKVILRRWYVVVPCLVVTLLVGVYLVGQAKPVYKASGSVVLSTQGRSARPDTTPSTLAGVNPYANMDQSQLAYLVSQAAGGSTLADEMQAAGATGTYSVVNIAGEPAMTVSTVAATPAEAMSSYRTLVRLLNSELARRQLAVGTPANTLVGVQDWTTPSSALPQNAARVKALIVVVTIGLLLTLALTFLIDAMLTNRAPWSGRRNSSRDEDDDDDDFADEFAAVDILLSGPVAVPAHLHADDRGRYDDDDDDQEPQRIPERLPKRTASRFEFALPSVSDRTAPSSLSDAQRRSGLPPWSPPEERPRAAGS